MGPFKGLMDIIYPPRCHGCGKFIPRDRSTGTTQYFCDLCFGDLVPLSSPRCSLCGIPFVSDSQEDHPCEDCLRKAPSYEAIHAPFLYEGVLMEVIHRLKYGGKSLLAESLGSLLAKFAMDRFKDLDGFLTIPVPLHPRRLRERGFNQSLLLARCVAEKMHTELDFLSLRRVRYTSPQTGLGRDARQRNVRGAFSLVFAGGLRGRSILLVDDVATTGNTLNECARVLVRSGCKTVVCLVLARAGRP